jgi:uncharacterized protein DUF4349
MSANDMSVETLLRAHAPHAPERLRERVLQLESRPSRRFAAPPRRLALVVVPAALAIAVAAAVVHGVVRSGHPAAVSDHAAPKSFGSGAATGGVGSAGGTATTPNAIRSALAPNAPAIESQRLAHTDAELRLRVADTDALSQATSQATRIATSLGGYAKSVDYGSSSSSGEGEATLDLRIPAQNVKTALARLSSLGTIVSQRLSVTDLQDRFRTESAQISQLRRRIAALQTALRTQVLQESQRVLLQIKLAESKRALAQRLNARKGTIAAAANASISLVIGTEKAVAPAPAPRSRLDRMLHSAVGFLALEGVIALYALIVASPFALAALLVWLWRRRSVDRLLST